MKINRTVTNILKSKEEIIIVGSLLLNVAGYLIGANGVMVMLHNFFHFTANGEIRAYIMWGISGSLVAWLVNFLFVSLLSKQNITWTFIGSIIGLAISILLCFTVLMDADIPMLYFLGMPSIFTGTYLGYRKGFRKEANLKTGGK